MAQKTIGMKTRGNSWRWTLMANTCPWCWSLVVLHNFSIWVRDRENDFADQLDKIFNEAYQTHKGTSSVIHW